MEHSTRIFKLQFSQTIKINYAFMAKKNNNYALVKKPAFVLWEKPAVIFPTQMKMLEETKCYEIYQLLKRLKATLICIRFELIFPNFLVKKTIINK